MPRPEYGELAPHFITASNQRSDYNFYSVAGRNVLLWFAVSTSRPHTRALLDFMQRHRPVFDDTQLSLFIISSDPQDQAQARVQDAIPGIRVLWDFDLQVAQRYGLIEASRTRPGKRVLRDGMVLLDPNLRGLRWFDTRQPASQLWAERQDALKRMGPPVEGAASPQAPVLILPRIFEPDFCRELIAYYESRGGSDSGYMRTRPDGSIEGVIDYRFKRRRDCIIEEEALAAEARRRIQLRLMPEIAKAFRFQVTRMERYLVACYDGNEGGYFLPHRDNDGTGHRQFAVTLNLNTEDYEGGDLKFPEYGQQTYRAPSGGACVFSCFLLHEATPVTRGTRYAFLPFLYDEASARLRERNNARYVDPKHHYSATPRAAAAPRSPLAESAVEH